MIIILAYSAARSDTDRFYPFLNSLKKQNNVNLSVVASYIHYIEKFGETIQHLKIFSRKRRFSKNSLKDSPSQLGKNLAKKFFIYQIYSIKKNLIF